MNQPTEDRFKRLEEEQRQLKEEMHKIREQATEPIKITRLEIDTGTMREEMKGVRADISSVKATQSDHSAFHIEHKSHLTEIETKQNTHTELLGQLINIGEDHTERFDKVETRLDRIEANMATKGDVASVKNDVASVKNDLGRLETIMMQILNRLPQPEGEK